MIEFVKHKNTVIALYSYNDDKLEVFTLGALRQALVDISNAIAYERDIENVALVLALELLDAKELELGKY